MSQKEDEQKTTLNCSYFHDRLCGDDIFKNMWLSLFKPLDSRAREYSLNCALFTERTQRKCVNHCFSLASGPPKATEVENVGSGE